MKNIRLTPRQKEIIEILSSCNGMSVNDLAEHFNASTATVRRELLFLENNMLITRSHGYAHKMESVISLYEKRGQNAQEEKAQIAKIALKYIKPDDAIIMDSGTTIYALATQIAQKESKELVVITNSLPIANILVGKCMLMLTGGMVDESSLGLLGPSAESFFDSIFADKLFLGGTGLIVEDGMPAHITVKSPFQQNIKKVMIKKAREHYVLIDSSKFMATAFNTLCQLEGDNTIITIRTEENAEKIEQLERMGIKVDYIDKL